MADVTEAGDALKRHPAFAKRLVQFMSLRDAAEALEELKPPNHETAAAYLREVADSMMRQAGIPEDFLQALIAARPPLEYSAR